MDYRKSKHTIILVQYTEDPNSRTYLDFESVNSAMDGVVKMYEAKLKQLNPNKRNITYDIQDLYNYIDSLADLSTLVYVASLSLRHCDLTANSYHYVDSTWKPERICQVARSGLRRRFSKSCETKRNKPPHILSDPLKLPNVYLKHIDPSCLASSAGSSLWISSPGSF
ncbi:Aste57867_2353 [Aphanomyces stellatus]|uniref:Aste57867_2353 protein n=1 Tax=Aphanomyces stellatus TaxID=120398 RepID=A0A485K8F9_9STRA|nr:hypothetical protein As57867_002348 [Aphanomyces stellatus]VFT79554.1 Aste57867_2353 [Aphanomyces stellatus]